MWSFIVGAGLFCAGTFPGCRSAVGALLPSVLTSSMISQETAFATPADCAGGILLGVGLLLIVWGFLRLFARCCGYITGILMGIVPPFVLTALSADSIHAVDEVLPVLIGWLALWSLFWGTASSSGLKRKEAKER